MSWRLAESLVVLSGEVLRRWPGTTIWAVGDQAHAARASDHNPNADGVVCAVDILAPAAGHVWDGILAARDLRIKYMIHRSEIVSSVVRPWEPRRYTGTNPHETHVHVSVGRGPSGKSTGPDLYDDPAPWGMLLPPDSTEGREMIGTGSGDTGPAIEALQRMIKTIRPDLLPKYGADGSWGQETSEGLGAILHGRNPRPVQELNAWAWELLLDRYAVAAARRVVAADVPVLIAAAIDAIPAGKGVDFDALTSLLDDRYLEHGETVTVV